MKYEFLIKNVFLSADKINRAKNVNQVEVTLASQDSADKLIFPVSSLKQRKMEEFLGPRQNELINEFVKYKGDKFKLELFEAYKDFNEYVDNEHILLDLNHMQRHALQDKFSRVLDLLDYDQIYKFLVDVVGIKAPSGLKEHFGTNDEEDGICSKEQTYLRKDYPHLVTLITIVKGSYFLLGKLATIMSPATMSARDYELFKFYMNNNKVFNSEAMKKLFEFTEKLIDSRTKNENEMYMRIIEKVVSEDDIVIVNLGQIVMQKLTIANTLNDNGSSHIVNVLFTFLTNKLRENGQSSKIREKITVGSTEEADQESHIESHRVIHDILPSDVEHINFATRTIDRILVEVSPKMRELMETPINLGDVTLTKEQVRALYDNFEHVNIPDEVFRFLEIIFKGMIDPRAICHLEYENVINLLTLGFIYLWNLGFKSLATFLGSTNTKSNTDELILSINITSGKVRLDKELLDALIEIYPLTKSNGKTKAEQSGDKEIYEIRKWVEMFGNELFKYEWLFILGEQFFQSLELEDWNVKVPEDIKVKIAEFLIANHNIVYRPKLDMEALVKKRPRIVNK